MTLKETIISACPEILDLRFGCRIKQKFMVRDFVEVLCEPTENDEGEKYIYTTHGHTSEKVYLERYSPSDNYIIEILGCPIELHHVLRAIKDAENLPFEERQKAIYYLVDLGWNLREPLENQTEETIAFLEKLLVRE